MSNDTLKTTVPENEARLRGERADVLVAGDILTRFWPNIDASVADSLIDTLWATKTVDGPYADQQEVDDGTFAVSDVYAEADGQRHVTIVQVLTKVWAGGELPTPLEMGRKQVLDVFSLEEGEGELVGHEYLYLHPEQRETYIAAAASESGFVEKDRRYDIEAMGNRTATMRVLFRKVTWNRWTGERDTPTKHQYDNVNVDDTDSSGEHAIIVNEWQAIDKQDLALAVSELRNGAHPVVPSGYVIVQVRVTDRHDGSITLSQTLIEQVDGVQITSRMYVKPLGLQPGYVDSIQVVYDEFMVNGLDAAVAGEGLPDGTYKNGGFKTHLKPSGRYMRIYTYLKATWPNNVAQTGGLTGQVDNKTQTGSFGYESENDMGKRRVDTMFGVPVAEAEKAVQNIAINKVWDEGNWVVLSIRMMHQGHGEAILVRELQKINTSVGVGDGLPLSKEFALGPVGGAVITRGASEIWPSITPAAAQTLVDSLEALTSTYSVWGTGSYVASNIEIRHHRESGLVDVIRSGKSRIGWGSGRRYVEGEIEPIRAEIFTDEDGVFWRKTTNRKITSSETDAREFANGSSAIRPAVNKKVQGRDSLIEYREQDGLWVAWQVIWESPKNDLTVDE